jgi:thiamine pyrophosphokinase
MRAFVIAGSPTGLPPTDLEPGQGDRVIAADYGAHHACAWGWPVHLLVGDLDSLPAGEAAALAAAGVPVITAPRAKDETDLELALARALEEGAREIVICAALGGRPDHLLANVLLLARPELAGVRVAVADGPVTIRMLRGGENKETGKRGDGENGREGAHMELAGAPGELLSLLPVGGDATGVTTRGLAYPLRDEVLHLGQGRGVSNVIESETVHVWLRAGLLLVIHTQLGQGPGASLEHVSGEGCHRS